jgi:putative nucleotidyltransferase with HDIG domain
MSVHSHGIARFGTPRLVARTLGAMLGTLVVVFGILFVAFAIEARGRGVRTAVQRLDGTDRLLSALEAERTRAAAVQAILASQRTLVDFVARPRQATVTPALARDLVHELDRAAGLLGAGAAVIVDLEGVVRASGGPHAAAWPAGRATRDGEVALGDNGGERLLRRMGRVYRVVPVPFQKDHRNLGELLAVTAVDDAYARDLARLTRTDVAVVLGQETVASSVPDAVRTSLEALSGGLSDSAVLEAAGRRHVAKTVLYLGRMRFYAVTPVDVGDGSVAGTSAQTVALLVFGALLLAALGSLWVARGVAQPIDLLSRQLRTMARARDFSRQLATTGSSLELDRLTETFNEMMASIAAAEAQTELAYVGAIKALAAALDCRDPYTAGHSERVSTLSVMIGRQLRLDDDDLEVLRLGALLHDIGKIGIRDSILTKPGPLTREEFDIIKTHPVIGAHMLRQVLFLCRHLPIVELHHERPDGRGYPHGLVGHATPLLARIVHVADAFDAMTSARAYRNAQPASHAIDELWRYAGSQFDVAVVKAFVTAWSADSEATEADVSRAAGAVLRFPDVRPTGSEG